MAAITLNVPGISCSHCEHTIKKAVSGLDGVDSIVVDLAGKTVKVSFDPGKATVDLIKKVIEDQGYEIL